MMRTRAKQKHDASDRAGARMPSQAFHLLVLRVPISVRVHRLPFPGVSAHLLNAVLSFPAEFIFRFGSIGVAGCDIAGAAWLDFIRNCFAAGFFVSLDNIEYAVAFAGAEVVDIRLAYR